LQNVIEYSIKDLDESKKDWSKDETFNINDLNLPTEVKKCWLIRESVEARHYINTTDTFLTECLDKYLLIETHIES
jgi:hypothetical protein